MKIIVVTILLTMAAWMPSALAKGSDDEVLLRSYIRFSLAQEVHAQAIKLGDDIAADKDEQIRRISDEWLEEEVDSLRADLDRQFGDGARTRFADFVSAFTTAEKSADSAYLDQLSSRVGLRQPPDDYRVLRRLALERWLQDQLTLATRLLSEMQTWAEVCGKEPNAPPLEAWLERNQLEQDNAPSRRPPVNPLRAAEAQAPVFDDTIASSGSALDSFAQRRRARREQAMQAAQAGMQQMAMERQSAEQDRAARIAADAQADADAMRAQAQNLASVEAEALAQRENSWGNRIKRIVGGTIGAGVGAFTGGIGTEAGQRAANEIFR